jgi:hypothetical protein
MLVSYFRLLVVIVAFGCRTTLSACINYMQTSGWTPFVMWRMYSNSSLLVIDQSGRFVVYSSTGSIFYEERVTLPLNPISQNKQHIAFAVFNPSEQLFVVLDDGFSYSYSAGTLSQKTAVNKIDMFNSQMIRGLYSIGLAACSNCIAGFAHNSATGAADIYSMAQQSASNQPLNNSYFTRQSTNPILNEFYIASYSKFIIVGKATPGNPTVINMTNANYATSYFAQNQAYTIGSSIGADANYMAYSFYQNRANLQSAYPQQIVIHRRGQGTMASEAVTDFHIFSIAHHPTQTKLFILTTRGELYVKSYTGNPTTPTWSVGFSQITLGSYLTYADIEPLDSNTLVFKNEDSMALFDLTTNSFRFHVSRKPTFGRNIPGTSLMFFAYYNFELKLYDTSTHAINTAYSYLGNVRQVIVNPSSTRPRMYLLLVDTFEVYTMGSGGTSYTLLTSKSLAQVQSIITPPVTGLSRLNDIDILINNPDVLVVLGLIKNSGSSATDGSAAILLTENTLAFRSFAYFVTGGLELAGLSLPGTSDTTKEIICGAGIDVMMCLVISPGPTFIGSTPLIDITFVLSDPMNANLANTKLVSRYYGNKVLSSINPSPSVYVMMSLQRSSGFAVSVTPPTGIGYYLVGQPYNHMNMRGIGRSQGNFTGKYLSNQNTALIIYDVSGANSITSRLLSGDIIPGIPYQNSDNIIYVTSGGDAAISISPTECYDPGVATTLTAYVACSVANCAACNFYSSTNCKRCVPPYILSADGTTCLSACSGYVLNGICYTACPIEYYKFNTATPKLCYTVAECAAAGKYIIGDRCTVTTCPTGSTANATIAAGGYCIPNSATNSITAASDTALSVRCPAGTLYWLHFKQCTAAIAGYTTDTTALPTPGNMYCDGSTHFYDVDSQRCLQTCGLYTGTHTLMGKICASAVGCGIVGYFSLDSTLTCLAACPGGMWTDKVNKKCVTSCPAGTLGVPSMLTCEAICPVNLYLQSVTPPSTCLTSTECKAISTNTGLLVQSSWTCVITCPANTFKLASTSQCLTSSECTAATASGGGLPNSADMTCISACPANTYFYINAGTTSCLTAAACKSTTTANNGGLLSEIDMKCVATCTGSQFLLSATSQCLTTAQCQAATSGGLTVPSTSTCVSSCTSPFYQHISTLRCLTNTECNAISFMIAPSTRLCENPCTVSEYLNAASTICYTKSECITAGLYWKDIASGNLCVTSCAPGEYLDSVDKACRTKVQCNLATKVVESIGYTCVPICPTSLAYKISGECFANCPTGYLLQEFDNSCVSSCPVLKNAQNTLCLRNIVLKVLAATPIDQHQVAVRASFFFEDDPSHQITQSTVLPTEVFANVCIIRSSAQPYCDPIMLSNMQLTSGLLTFTITPPSNTDMPDNIEVTPNYAIQRFFDGFRGQFSVATVSYNVSKVPANPSPAAEETSNSRLSSIAKGLSVVATVSRATSPFLISTIFDMRSGSVLCLIGQTYTKLVMMTYFSFDISASSWSSLYYNTFKEFLDDLNEQLLDYIIGCNAVAENKAYVCRKGFSKLCSLTVEDNFWLAHLLSFGILLLNTIAILLLMVLFKIIRKPKYISLLLHKLKYVLVFAFLLENNLEFWFTLILNAHIHTYEIIVLSVSKVVGFIILALYVAATILFIRHHLVKSKPYFSIDFVFSRFKEIVSEISVSKYADNFLKIWLLHDAAMGIVNISGSYLGSFQVIIWAVVELLLLGVVIKFKVFQSKLLMYRQLFIGSGFLMLSILMALVPYLHNYVNEIAIAIFFISVAILLLDLAYMAYEYCKVAISLAIHLFSKKKNSNKVKTAATIHMTTNSLDLLKIGKIGHSKALIKSMAKVDALDSKVQHTPLLQNKSPLREIHLKSMSKNLGIKHQPESGFKLYESSSLLAAKVGLPTFGNFRKRLSSHKLIDTQKVSPFIPKIIAHPSRKASISNPPNQSLSSSPESKATQATTPSPHSDQTPPDDQPSMNLLFPSSNVLMTSLNSGRISTRAVQRYKKDSI